MPNWWDKYSPAPAGAVPRGLPAAGDPTVTSGAGTAFMPALSSDTPPYQTNEDRANIALSTLLPRGSVQALQNTPGHAFRMEQAKGAADTQKQLEQAQNAGRKILRSYGQLRARFDNTPDDVLQSAIGPRNMADLDETSPTFIPFTHIPVPGFSGPTTVDPQTNLPIAGKITPVQRAAILNPEDKPTAAAWNLQNLLGHDVHGITNAFMSNAGKSLNMSDTRQEAFDSTMRDFMKATNRKEAAEILDHARGIISNDFGIPPYEADKIITEETARLRAQQDNGNSPHPSSIKLLQAHPTPDYIQQFNERYGAGAAEKILGHQ